MPSIDDLPHRVLRQDEFDEMYLRLYNIYMQICIYIHILEIAIEENNITIDVLNDFDTEFDDLVRGIISYYINSSTDNPDVRSLMNKWKQIIIAIMTGDDSMSNELTRFTNLSIDLNNAVRHYKSLHDIFIH